MTDGTSGVSRIGIIGAGTMGSGIAISAAQHGVTVDLVDASQEAVDRAVDGARAFYAKAVERGRMEAADAAAAGERISGGHDLERLGEVDLVIEAVFEDFDVKAELYGRLNPILRPEMLVATNTSCLTVSGLAAHVDRPERFLGLHFFNPAAISPIVEVVRGARTDDSVIARSLAYCRETGKKPLLCLDRNGFALNRFFCPYCNEAVRVMEEGLGTPAEIDRVAQAALGAAAGPFRVMNLVRTRIALHAQRNLEALGPYYEATEGLVRIGEKNADWEIGEAAAVEGKRADAIAERLRAGVFLPVLQSLDEDVASPADIDSGAELALKFGRPPCALMDELGRETVTGLLRPLCDRYETPLPAALGRVGSLRGNG